MTWDIRRPSQRPGIAPAGKIDFRIRPLQRPVAREIHEVMPRPSPRR